MALAPTSLTASQPFDDLVVDSNYRLAKYLSLGLAPP